jgi:hypothetical protein
MFRSHHLSPDPIAVDTTDDFTSEDLSAGGLTSLTDSDAYVIHGTFHATHSRVASNHVLGR